MKTLNKNLFTSGLAIAMVCAMALPAFADNSNSNFFVPQSVEAIIEHNENGEIYYESAGVMTTGLLLSIISRTQSGSSIHSMGCRLNTVQQKSLRRTKFVPPLKQCMHYAIILGLKLFKRSVEQSW